MYYFYINDCLLPVAPSKLNIKIKNQNKTVTLSDGAEYNIVKIPGLTDIDFECLIPAVKYPFAVYENGEFKDAGYFLDAFEELKTQGKSFTFRIIRGGDLRDTLFDVTLEDYSIEENASEGRDYTVSVKLKQYNPQKTKTISVSNQTENTVITTSEERAINKETENISYTIVYGDTMWGIAKRYLGNGALWTRIYQDNKEIIDSTAKKYGHSGSSGGALIFPGTVLTIKGATA